MKKSLKIVLSIILSFLAVFGMFLITDMYTLWDIPTPIVIIRYIGSSIFGSIALYLFFEFIKKYKNDIGRILSVVSLLPFAGYILAVIVLTLFTSGWAAYNFAAVGLLMIFIFGILCIPGFILSVLSIILDKKRSPLTLILGIIGILLWGFLCVIEIHIFL